MWEIKYHAALGSAKRAQAGATVNNRQRLGHEQGHVSYASVAWLGQAVR